jgi:hypothetical protein
MSRALYLPPRPLSVGEVIDLAFRIFRATLIKCLPYGVLVVIAGQLPNLYDIATGRPLREFGGPDAVWWVIDVLGALLALVPWNATVLHQYAVAAGRPAAAALALREALRRSPRVALLGILAVAAIGILALLPFAWPTPYRLWGFIVLVIPVTYIGMVLPCAWTALLIAEKGVIESILYSFRLTSGNWWRLTIIYTVGLVMVLFVLGSLAGAVAALVVPFFGGADLAVITAVWTDIIVALSAASVPFYSALVLTVFGDLQVRKEGIDLERRIAGAAAE